jgi:hypothetical protein
MRRIRVSFNERPFHESHNTIFEELQNRAPHPLPDYNKPLAGKEMLVLQTLLTPALSFKERGNSFP